MSFVDLNLPQWFNETLPPVSGSEPGKFGAFAASVMQSHWDESDDTLVENTVKDMEEFIEDKDLLETYVLNMLVVAGRKSLEPRLKGLPALQRVAAAPLPTGTSNTPMNGPVVRAPHGSANGQGSGMGGPMVRARPEQGTQRREQRACHTCQQVGHISRNCPQNPVNAIVRGRKGVVQNGPGAQAGPAVRMHQAQQAGQRGGGRQAAIVLTHVPFELNSLAKLSMHFSKFGGLVGIQCDVQREQATVTFDSSRAASAALGSTEAVLGNRFITMQWAQDFANQMRTKREDRPELPPWKRDMKRQRAEPEQRQPLPRMAPGANKLVTEAFKKAQEDAKASPAASVSAAEAPSARPDEEPAPESSAAPAEPALSPEEQEAARAELARKRKELRDADMATQRQLMKLLGNKSVPPAERALLLDNLKKVTLRVEKSLAMERRAAGPVTKKRRTYVNPALAEQKARGASVASKGESESTLATNSADQASSTQAPEPTPAAPVADDRKSAAEEDEEDVDADW